jgi:hypothetical protein
VAEQDGARCSWLILILTKGSAERGLDAKQREEIPRHRAAEEADGLFERGQRQAAVSMGREPFEGPALRLPVPQVLERDPTLLDSPFEVRLVEEDQLVGVGETERGEQGGINDTEDRGVDSDPKGEAGHRHEREERAPEKGPGPVAKILNEGIHRLLLPK